MVKANIYTNFDMPRSAEGKLFVFLVKRKLMFFPGPVKVKRKSKLRPPNRLLFKEVHTHPGGRGLVLWAGLGTLDPGRSGFGIGSAKSTPPPPQC